MNLVDITKLLRHTKGFLMIQVSITLKLSSLHSLKSYQTFRLFVFLSVCTYILWIITVSYVNAVTSKKSSNNLVIASLAIVFMNSTYFLPAVHMSSDGDVQRGDRRLHLRAQRHRRAGERVLTLRGEHLRIRFHHRMPGVRMPGR